MFWIIFILSIVFLIVVTVYGLTQRKHAILRNYPIIGHFRYPLEAVGSELRQYIATDNNEERPFSRDQRRWVYSSAENKIITLLLVPIACPRFICEAVNAVTLGY